MDDNAKAPTLVDDDKFLIDFIEIEEPSKIDQTSEQEIISFLKENKFDFGVTFPSSRLKRLIQMIEDDKDIFTVSVTREEEGIGVCAGAYLAGKKPFMLIQSSGLGNSINAIASLLKTYRIPILILAEHRGSYNEKIPAQVPLGIALPGILEAMKIPFMLISSYLDSMGEFSRINFDNNETHVALLSPELF
jgi:sulfopyruvate decarboxylase alpha subunit